MSTPTKYDANIIQTFAVALYKKAKAVVIDYTVRGAVLGALCGFALLLFMNTRGANNPPANAGGLIIILVLVFGLIGYRIGKSRAFDLKLKAQTALCQVQIEKNTRKVDEAAK